MSKEIQEWRSIVFMNTDHPDTILVTSALTNLNYLSWSRSVKIVLRTRLKLGFVNGRSVLRIMTNGLELTVWSCLGY